MSRNARVYNWITASLLLAMELNLVKTIGWLRTRGALIGVKKVTFLCPETNRINAVSPLLPVILMSNQLFYFNN
jgi:hypothetical protein